MSKSPKTRVLKAAIECIYCGRGVPARRRGEHIVQKALGATRRIKRVCTECNNALSLIDDQLVDKSYLGIAVRLNLPGQGVQGFDYDPIFDLALEAEVRAGLESPMTWPQAVLDESAILTYGFPDEMSERERRRHVLAFRDHVLRARRTLGQKHSRWRWEAVRNPPRTWRYPPRIYTKHPFAQITEASTFTCRYRTGTDHTSILERVDAWATERRRLVSKSFEGVRTPEHNTRFRPRDVRRALVKIGLNLLANYCKDTWVSRKTFHHAVEFVRYDRGMGGHLDPPGFLCASGLASFKCPDDSHMFCLSHDRSKGCWTLVCIFFGGQIGAMVEFPGPNDEDWVRLEAIVPIRSNDWRSHTSAVLLPSRQRITDDIHEILPDIPIINADAKIIVTKERARG